jgi:hypothetical protein
VDSTSILPFAALLVGAIVIAVILVRVMYARQRAAEKLPPPPAAGDDEFLDSSHIGGPILPGADPRQSDAAARAAAALRNARQKP